MDPRYILAIDQGTTGTTVMVFDTTGAVCGRAYGEFTQHYPQPGWVEHNADEIWAVTHRVAGESLQVAGIQPGDLRAIGITNQRETVVLWDRISGQPVGRAVVWQDRRTAGLCDELKARGLETVVRSKTGLLIDPYFSATKIAWLLDNVPNLRNRAEAGEIAFGTVDSWLVWKLTGGQAHITEVSNASRTLLYNIRDLAWDGELLETFDIPSALLPEVKPSAQVYGHTAPHTFFGTAVPVAGIAGDQQASLFGQACHTPGMAKNTYGTGSFVLMNTGASPVPSEGALLTTIAWQLEGEPVEYALEGAIFATGAAVQWLRDGLEIIHHAAESEALARSVSDNAGVYFVPALAGLGSPHWDPYARGLLVGITRGTSRGHVVRAVLESMAYQTRDVVTAMEQESGIPLQELRADGGAAVNGFLMQFQADMLGVPVEVPQVTETTALGAAYLAGLATGLWQSREELAAHWAVAQRYTPTMADIQREALYRRWRQAIERSRGWAREE